MSLQASSWAIGVKKSPEYGGKAWPARKLLLMILANRATPSGVLWTPQKQLAEDMECEVSAVGRALLELEELGLVARAERYNDNRRMSDVIVLGAGVHRGDMLHPDDDGAISDSNRDLIRPLIPDPTLHDARLHHVGTTPLQHTVAIRGKGTLHREAEEENGNTSYPLNANGAGSARARISHTYEKHPVDRQTLEGAQRILSAFNERFGHSYSAFRKTGTMSGNLREIVGVLFDEPNESADTWVRGVKNWTRPNWIEEHEDVDVGKVFGPKARRHTLSCAKKIRKSQAESARETFAKMRRIKTG